MKIIFMGTPDFSVGTLDALNKAGHEIILVVTQPDKPVGRKGILTPPPVKQYALEHGFEVYQPERIRRPECVEYLKQYEADVMVVVAFGQILPKEILDMPKHCCVNIHASLLPKYRGAAPIQWSVIDGEKETGVCSMRMDEGMDTGDVIMTEVVKISEEETGGSLFDKLESVGAELCIKTLNAIETGEAVYTPQDHDNATYTKMIKKQDGLIDWNKSSQEIECLVRGMNPWPSAFTKYNEKMLKIWKATIADDEFSDSDEVAGTFIEAGKKLYIKTGSGALLIDELQLEGKKRMYAKDFLNGTR